MRSKTKARPIKGGVIIERRKNCPRGGGGHSEPEPLTQPKDLASKFAMGVGRKTNKKVLIPIWE